MKGDKKKKIIKTIKVDVDKCNGCRACEVICSAFHAAPKYSSNNPARSRIRVIREPLKDLYVPVRAGDYAVAECAGRDKYTIDGKEYDECAFCRASCPSRDEFKEPDSGLPLKCDMCEGEDEPLCVKWCGVNALVYEEREEEVEEGEEPEELEIGSGIAGGQIRIGKNSRRPFPNVKEGLNNSGERRGSIKTVETVAPFKEVIDEIKAAGGEAYRFCFQCGLCDTVCPWNRVRPFSIRKIIREATFGLTEIESEDIWRCTTCGRCPQRCPRGVKQIEVGVSLRRVASEYEVFPASVRSARTARASLISEGNPLQADRKKRADWAQGLPVKTFSRGDGGLVFRRLLPQL